MAQVARALSDDQVAGELRKMVQFIKQEAMEKAREIHIKADEEFAIEKAKLVRSETSGIDATYERKQKAALLAQQVSQSNVANKARLKILGARQEVLVQVFDKAREKLSGVEKQKSYPQLLKDLVLECAFGLMDKHISILAKEGDYEKIRPSIGEIQSTFKKQTGMDLEVSLDTEHPLPKDGHGGVRVLGGNGKIDVNNTLEMRLKLLETEALPSIRAAIFGESEHRRFHD